MDGFSENNNYFFGEKVEKEGYLNYMYLSEANPVVSLYNIIRGNILNKASNISTNDNREGYNMFLYGYWN